MEYTNWQPERDASGPVNSMRMLEKNFVWNINATQADGKRVRLASLADFPETEGAEISCLMAIAPNLLAMLEKINLIIETSESNERAGKRLCVDLEEEIATVIAKAKRE